MSGHRQRSDTVSTEISAPTLLRLGWRRRLQRALNRECRAWTQRWAITTLIYFRPRSLNTCDLEESRDMSLSIKKKIFPIFFVSSRQLPLSVGVRSRGDKNGYIPCSYGLRRECESWILDQPLRDGIGPTLAVWRR